MWNHIWKYSNVQNKWNRTKQLIVAITYCWHLLTDCISLDPRGQCPGKQKINKSHAERGWRTFKTPNIHGFSKATLTCALEARAWAGTGHASKFQKPLRREQRWTELPKQTAWLLGFFMIKLSECMGRIMNLPNQQADSGNSPAAAMAARVGRHGSKRIKVYQMLMRPHRWFLGSFLNLALQELGFFPSSRCSEMPQRRCDFGGKLAANPQRPLGSLLCTYLHAEGLPWLQPRWKKCIPTKQLCSSSLKPF